MRLFKEADLAVSRLSSRQKYVECLNFGAFILLIPCQYT